ncbi:MULTISPECIES: TIGR03086 family metal-binding protein [Streptomyces]|uniref:Putative Actinobacterial protein n=1 Tax=Streptomyces chartreusis NRRL 3882 TaxID=1079985 RepID=A0A2N9B688_STRCX|nr:MULTISPECIES: TIGR03086 family metal-binding protein [Streptomyces]MYS95551.1 TIGR03086 family protein [Streptomyces sp. SID5464]SOR78890.1 putative Actinobacterial protein [Streptomyces chartreusis NRRL 3882]
MTNDPRPLFARAAQQAAELIASVRAEQLDGPTPCTEFDVRTLLSHLTGGARRVAVVAEGGDAAAVRPFAEDVPDDGWTAAYDEARTRAVKAWAGDDLLDTVVRLPFGEMPGRAAVSAYVLETVTHAWDLSEALGHPRELDPELAEFALTVAQRMLPDEQRDENTPFASARPAPEGADVYGRLAAWLGREPLSRA